MSDDDLRIDAIDDPAIKGQRFGMGGVWIVATHIPTMAQVRCYFQIAGYKEREQVLALLEMAVDCGQSDDCQNPSIFDERGNLKGGE